MLRQLLQSYPDKPFKFKIASRMEALRRNDTIVSWHQNFDDARVWANIAQSIVGQNYYEGHAPAGSFGSYNSAVGIDHEVPGETTTQRMADDAVYYNLKRNIRKNPYI